MNETELKLNKYAKIMSILIVVGIAFTLLHTNLIEHQIDTQAQFNKLKLFNIISFWGQVIVKIALLIFSIKTIQLFKLIDRKKSSLKNWYGISWFLVVIISIWIIFTVITLFLGLFS